MTTSKYPDLSIVIVNWNTMAMLRDVLTSTLKNCGNISIQVIVVDNASEDDSANMVISEFPEVLIIQNMQNLGFAAANNQGFKVATGRHILLLNSDTIVLGDVLAASVRYLDEHSDVGAMGCRVLNTNGTMQRTCAMWPSITNLALQTSGLWRLPYPRILGRYHMMDWQRDSERDVDSISGCYLMIRRNILEEVGSLDEDFFFFGEETDWCRRMRDSGWRVVFAPVGEIIHHGGASAQQLNHRRDLLLTNATVRLHKKHRGILAMMIVWILLFLHNLTRAIFWSIRSTFEREENTQERAQHFRNVTLGQLGGIQKLFKTENRET